MNLDAISGRVVEAVTETDEGILLHMTDGTCFVFGMHPGLDHGVNLEVRAAGLSRLVGSPLGDIRQETFPGLYPRQTYTFSGLAASPLRARIIVSWLNPPARAAGRWRSFDPVAEWRHQPEQGGFFPRDPLVDEIAFFGTTPAWNLPSPLRLYDEQAEYYSNLRHGSGSHSIPCPQNLPKEPQVAVLSTHRKVRIRKREKENDV